MSNKSKINGSLKNKTTNGSRFLSGIIVILLIAIGVVAFFIYYQPNRDVKEVTNNNEEETNDSKEVINDNQEENNDGKEEKVAKELVIANEVKVNKDYIELAKGESQTFTITVTGVAGLIDVTSSDNNIVTVSTNNADCNGTLCFYDALTDSPSTIEYTVTSVGDGNGSISISLPDILTYDEVPVTGNGKIDVLVK